MPNADLISNIVNSVAQREDSEETIARAQGAVQERVQQASTFVDPFSSDAPSESRGGGGAYSAFRKSFATSTGPLQEFADYMISEYPSLGTNVTESFRDATPQERRQMIIDHRAQEAEKFWGTTGDHPVASFMGEMAGEMVDPTTVLPFAKGIRAAMLGGGVIGGVSATTEGLAEEGAVDPEKFLLHSAVGAATGGLIEAAIVQPISKVLARYRNSGQKATADGMKAELQNAIPDSDRVDWNTLSQELNANFKLDSQDPEINQIVNTALDIKDLSGRKTELGFSYPEADHFDYRWAKVDDYLVNGTPLPKDGTGFSSLLPKAEDVDFYRELTIKPNKRTHEALYNKLESEINSLSNYKKTRSKSERSIDKVVDGKKKKVSTKQPYDQSFGLKQIPIGSAPPMRATREKLAGRSAEYLDEQLAVKLSEKQEVFNVLDRAAPVGSPLYSKIKNESLEVQGAKLAYSPTGEPGSEMYNIIANQHVPWTSDIGQKMRPHIGDAPSDNLFPEMSWIKTSSSAERMMEGAASVTSPAERLKYQAGNWGKLAVKYLDDAQVMRRYRSDETLVNYRKGRNALGIKQGSPEELLMLQVGRRTVDASKVSPAIRKAAEDFANIFNKGYREAHEVGIVSTKEYAQNVKRGIEKGHIPRVTDMDKLSTKKGREEFIQRLSSKTMSKESAESIVQSIARTPEEANAMIKQIGKNGELSYFPAQLAEKLWREYNIISPTYRSKYLEAPRRLPEEWEDVMEPFLVNDAEAILAEWSRDVFTRIEHAKIFGAKDELAVKLSNEIGLENPDAQRLFDQLYWTGVGDPKSELVKSFVDKPRILKQAVSRIKAFQTMKLVFAQIPNSVQANVHGLDYIMGQTHIPLPKRVGMWVKNGYDTIKATFGDAEAKATLDMFGAANDTMMLDATGGINEGMHTIAGRRMEGVFSPLEVLNNPTVMLRKVAYFDIEKFQRRYGQILGQTLLEDALKRKQRLLGKGNRANPKHLESINNLLLELGMDPTADPSKYSVKDVGLAGQRASNILNFTTDAKDAPLVMQTFYGKFFSQFKTYITRATNFHLKKTIGPAIKAIRTGGKEGTLAPLAAHMGVGVPIFGMPIDAFRRWIFSDDRELSMTEKYVRANLLIGTFAIAGDLVERSVRSAGGFAEFLAGPTVGDAGKLIYKAGQTDNPIEGTGAAAKEALRLNPLSRRIVDKIAEDRPSGW